MKQMDEAVDLILSRLKVEIQNAEHEAEAIDLAELFRRLKAWKMKGGQHGGSR